MKFNDAILAGVVLNREAIQSENYSSGLDGWIIRKNGSAEFGDLNIRSSNGTGSTVAIVNGTATFKAANNYKIVIDPTQTLPVIDFLDSAGATAGSINTNPSAGLGLILSGGKFPDVDATDWRWAQVLGNGATIFRVRESDTSIFKGGASKWDVSGSYISYQNSANTTLNTFVQVISGTAAVTGGRFAISGIPVSANSAVLIDAATGHTGNLIRARVNSVDQFTVGPTGNVAIAGDVTATNIQSGRVTILTDGTWQTVAVTFAKPFATIPQITATPSNNIPAATTTSLNCATRTASTTGFTLGVFRSTAVNQTIDWIAISS